MKKLTAGIFATILGLTAMGAADAAIPTQNYVDEAVGSVRSTVTGIANNIATYGDIVTHNVSEFATAAQGTKADTALQAADLNGYAKTADLGTAAFTPSTDYATAAQGTKADNAATTIATYGDIVTHNVSEFATAAQGALADTALQEADLADYAKTADVVTNSEFATFETSNTAAIADAKKAGTDAQTTANANAATIATYGDIVTHNASEFATAAQGTKADTALQAVACSDPNGCVLMADGTAQALVNTYVSEEN